jgi:hypothetical protein
MVVRVVPQPIVGTCGEVRDRQFETFEADLDWLEVSGVKVTRVDPTTRPDALSAAPDADRAWKEERRAALPMIVIDGHVASRGALLSRSQLAHVVGQHRRVHSVEMVRHVAALGATAAVGTDEDLVLELKRARELHIDDDDIEVAVEAGRYVSHHGHSSALGEHRR